MPNLDLPQPPALDADADAKPVMQPTIVPTERSLSDLYTGGWRRRLSGLPTTLGRPLAQWSRRGWSVLAPASKQNRTDQDPTPR